MKKLNAVETKKVIGGGDCWGNYQWSGNRCEFVTYCKDKHGSKKMSSVPAANANFCPAR